MKPQSFAQLPSPTSNPTGERLSAPFVTQRGHTPLLSAHLPPPVLSPEPRGCRQGRLITSLCNFPSFSPRVARFLGPFLSLQPSGVPSPQTPAKLQRPPSPPFPQPCGGARVSLMHSRLCLSHPSRVAGSGKHEKEPIWLLTSPPALLSLSSPLPFQSPTPPLPSPFCRRQNQTDKLKTQTLIKLRSGTTFPSH